MGLYLIAAPIGTATDITLRSLQVLLSVDVLVAEDKRMLTKLMNIHSIPRNRRPMLSYHDHNGAYQRSKILDFLMQGRSVAFLSDAGTPLIADPGYQLVREVISQGFRVHSLPGASALLVALTVSGIPPDRFAFAGFIPTKRSARESLLFEFGSLPMTVIFYETPSRLRETLSVMDRLYGSERRLAVCRELTKKFEEVFRGTVGELKETFLAKNVKGEIVLVLEPFKSKNHNIDLIDKELEISLKNSSVKDSVSVVAETLGLSKRLVYNRALNLKNNT